MKNHVFWGSAFCFFASLNTIGAVMSAGVPGMDSGSGFICFSPAIDYMLWGLVAIVSGLVMAWALWSEGLELARFPGPFRFPLAYGATLGVLSLGVVALGILELTYPYGGHQIPLWWYMGLLAGCYLLAGFLGGRWSKTLGYDLLWAAAVTAVIVGLGVYLLRMANGIDAKYTVAYGNSYMPSYTAILDRPLGALLGRVNLPACVIMDSYYSSLRERGFDRNTVTFLVCLLPPVLYTVGWLAGWGSKRRRKA